MRTDTSHRKLIATFEHTLVEFAQSAFRRFSNVIHYSEHRRRMHDRVDRGGLPEGLESLIRSFDRDTKDDFSGSTKVSDVIQKELESFTRLIDEEIDNQEVIRVSFNLILEESLLVGHISDLYAFVNLYLNRHFLFLFHKGAVLQKEIAFFEDQKFYNKIVFLRRISLSRVFYEFEHLRKLQTLRNKSIHISAAEEKRVKLNLGDLIKIHIDIILLCTLLDRVELRKGISTSPTGVLLEESQGVYIRWGIHDYILKKCQAHIVEIFERIAKENKSSKESK